MLSLDKMDVHKEHVRGLNVRVTGAFCVTHATLDNMLLTALSGHCLWFFGHVPDGRCTEHIILQTNGALIQLTSAVL